MSAARSPYDYEGIVQPPPAPPASPTFPNNEAIDDRVAQLLVPGPNVTISYDDPAGKITISSTGGGGGGGAADWDDITDKPSTFPPSSHSHPISEVTGLQTTLDLKAPLASPALTGAPTAPTASPGTSTTQLATTAFVGAAVAAGGGGGAAIAISDTAPGSPTDGQLWWESDSGTLFIRYNDGTSSQWVSMVGPAGPTVVTGGSGITDGDKGDIIVSGSGLTWMFDSAVVTAAARTVLDDANVGAMRTTLGAAAASHTHTTAEVTGLDTALAGKAPSSHTHAQADVTNLVSDLALKAPLASPALTGSPTAPTATLGDSTTKLATTAFVAAAVSGATGGTIGEAPNDGTTYGRKNLGWIALDTSIDWTEVTGKPTTFTPTAHNHPQSEVTNLVADLALKAPLASPAFTGTPTAPTPLTADDSTKVATTEWVKDQGFGTGSAVTISATAPGSPVDGQLWWESDSGALFIRYNDGTSSQWVSMVGPAGPAVVSGGSGISDGDKGDIIVSDAGLTWMFDTSVVTAAAKTVLDDTTVGAMRTTLGAAAASHTHAQADITNLVTDLAAKAALVHTHLWADITDKPATFAPAAHNQATTTITFAASDKLLGRATAGAGQGEEITCTSQARQLLDDTTFPAMLTTLGAAAASHTHTVAQITDIASSYQPLDADLTALAAVTGTNTLYYRSAANTWTAVVMGGNMSFAGGTLNATGFAASSHTHAQADITNLVTDLGNKQAADATLTALAGLSATAGLLEQTAADTFAKRAIGAAAATDVLTRADGDGRYSLTGHTHAGVYAPASHTHAQADVTNLVSDLALKAPLASPAFTGTPTAPTVSLGDNSTGIATTAWVKGQGYGAGGGGISDAPNDGQVYGRQSLGWTVLDVSIDWLDITGKPSTFAPSAHTHAAADTISGTFDIALLPVATSGTSNTTQVVRADDSRLSNARTPTAHNHTTAEVTGLDTALTNKQAADATLTALAGLDATAGLLEQTGADAFAKRAMGVGATTSVLTRADGDGRYSLTAHTHAGVYEPADATLTALAGLNTTAGLLEQTGSDAFAKRALGVAAGTSIPTRADADTRYAAASHTHTVSQITDIASTYAPISHSHTAANITDFQEAVEDRIGLSLINGTNVTITYDDGTGKTTINAAAGGGGVTISETPPGSPTAGQLWWESDTGSMYVYYNDGSSSQWVTVGGPQGAVKPPTISTSAPSGGVDGDVWYQVV